MSSTGSALCANAAGIKLKRVRLENREIPLTELRYYLGENPTLCPEIRRLVDGRPMESRVHNPDARPRADRWEICFSLWPHKRRRP